MPLPVVTKQDVSDALKDYSPGADSLDRFLALVEKTNPVLLVILSAYADNIDALSLAVALYAPLVRAQAREDANASTTS